MKRYKRNPEKFDVIDLFDAIGRDRKLTLNSLNSESVFLDSIRSSLAINKTETMIWRFYIQPNYSE